MKKLFLAYGLLAISFSSAFAQTLDWKKNLFPTPQSHPSVGGPISSRINACRFGPDGRIYSIGYFGGNRVNFNGVVVKADSIGFRNWRIASGANPGANIPESILISCHESNGNLAWVRTLTSAENTAFSIMSGQGDTYSGRNSLHFDNSGNLLVAGAIVGDTLSYNGIPFEFDPSYGQRVFVLRISSDGNLLWGRSQQAGAPEKYPAARFSREFNGDLEAFFTGASTNTGNMLLLRSTATGSPLASIDDVDASTFTGLNGLSALENLPNGRFLLGSLSFQAFPLRASIVELNSDLTTYQQTTANLNNSSTLVPTSFHTLSDSQRVVILSTNFIVGGTNRFIWGLDTLNFTASPSSAPERSVFVRTSNLTCMKKVGYLDYVTVGQNVTTPNGNIVLMRQKNVEESGVDLALSLKLIDKNGGELGNLPLGNLGISGGIKDGYMYSNRHQLSWNAGSVAGCFGTYLFKASFPDPIVEPQSFSGCLSNRNILLGTNQPHVSKFSLVVFEKEPGQWEVRSTEGTQAELQLVSLLGQRLQTLKMKDGVATFCSNGLPGGMYLLQSTSKNGAETQRFVVK